MDQGSVAVLRRHADNADQALKSEARDRLIERLIAGHPVGRCTARDVFDSALNCKYTDLPYQRALDILVGVLSLTGKTQDERRLAVSELETKAREFLDNYLDSDDDLIDDEAARLEAGRRNDD